MRSTTRDDVPRIDELFNMMRAAKADQDAWGALERPFVRCLMAKRGMNVESAARMFAAFRRAPRLLPFPPPHGSDSQPA